MGPVEPVLRYPTWGKGKIQQRQTVGDILVPTRVNASGISGMAQAYQVISRAP